MSRLMFFFFFLFFAKRFYKNISRAEGTAREKRVLARLRSTKTTNRYHDAIANDTKTIGGDVFRRRDRPFDGYRPRCGRAHRVHNCCYHYLYVRLTIIEKHSPPTAVTTIAKFKNETNEKKNVATDFRTRVQLQRRVREENNDNDDGRIARAHF